MMGAKLEGQKVDNRETQAKADKLKVEAAQIAGEAGLPMPGPPPMAGPPTASPVGPPRGIPGGPGGALPPMGGAPPMGRAGRRTPPARCRRWPVVDSRHRRKCRQRGLQARRKPCRCRHATNHPAARPGGRRPRPNATTRRSHAPSGDQSSAEATKTLTETKRMQAETRTAEANAQAAEQVPQLQAALVQSVQAQSVAIAEQGRTMAAAIEEMARILAAPKRIVHDQGGHPVGVETLAPPPA